MSMCEFLHGVHICNQDTVGLSKVFLYHRLHDLILTSGLLAVVTCAVTC